MKKLLLSIILSVSALPVFAQFKANVKPEQVLEIFHEEAKPYLDEYATVNAPVDELLRFAVTTAKLKKFESKISRMEAKILQLLFNEEPSEQLPKLVLSLATQSYEEHFIGLPQEFYDRVNKRVEEL